MEKPDISELFRAHGFFGPPAGEVKNEGKCIEETVFLTAVDSLLSSVKHEPVDMGDEAILRRLRSTTECLKEYKEAINTASNVEVTDDEGEDEAAAEEVEAAASGVLGMPVPALSAEAEELLRGARALHRQTAELRSFLKDLLLEEGQGEGVPALSCPEPEESTVTQMIASRKIAEKREELKLLKNEEYPVAFLPDHLKKSLNKCVRMLSGDKAKDEPCSDELSEQVDGE